MTQQKEKEVDRFLEFFYQGTYCEKLFSPFGQLNLTELEDKTQVLQINSSSKEIVVLNHLCVILSFIITHHGMFSKNFLLNQEHILRSVSYLMKSNQSHIKLGNNLLIF